MFKIELYNHDDIGGPPASFATDAEIEIADQLRHQLEERYLGPSAPYSPLQVRSATTTTSIRRMPRAVWRRVAGSSEQSEA